MNFYNFIRTAWYSIRAYKLRIFLTMIGIIIGISSVSAILAIGEGLKAEASSSMESANLNKVTIEYMPPSGQEDASATPFDESDISEIKKIEGVKDVTMNDNQNNFLMGTYQDMSYFDKSTAGEVNNYSEKDAKIAVGFGRGFSKAEAESDSRVIILGYEMAKQLFDDPERAIGKGVTVKGEVFEVVGVKEEVAMDMGLNFSMEFSDPNASTIPSKVDFGEEETDQIWNISVALEPGGDKDMVLTEVKDKLYELHPDVQGEYMEFDMEKIIESMQSVIGNITLFVAFVTGISLLVGGIGVMNIMYVSVTERKREIGIRRAIGAKPKDILVQFLIESIFITGLGGIIGIAFGYLFSMAVGAFLPFPPVMTLKNFLGASSISVLTGLVFGIIPASKAAKLDPIVAIYK